MEHQRYGIQYQEKIIKNLNYLLKDYYHKNFQNVQNFLDIKQQL